MIKMRARACIKCRMYVIVHTETSVNRDIIKKFEGMHIGHNLVTLDLDEVQGTYTNFEKPDGE